MRKTVIAAITVCIVALAGNTFWVDSKTRAERYLQANAETLDWMYQGDEAIGEFAKMTGIPEEQARITRDKFYPRNNQAFAPLRS
jgi:hypothetical protein